MSDHVAKVRAVAEHVARRSAADVDRQARFPHESIAALREERLLAAGIPKELGGLGCSFTEIAAMCTALGRACASTATIFSMHQAQLGCLVKHGSDMPPLRAWLRGAATQQWLIASATSEVGDGGDLRLSASAVEPSGTRFKVAKRCAVVSYGEQADAILLTARRNPQAAPGDQVLVLLRRGEYKLQQRGSWDTLGLRGTCGPAFDLTAEAHLEQVLGASFRDIAAQTMVPYAHIMWSAAWVGLATDAVSVARSFIRSVVTKAPDAPMDGANLVGASKDLQVMNSAVSSAAREYERLSERLGGGETLSSMSYALEMNNLKLAASEFAVQICMLCLRACGVSGYRNDGEFSVARHVRDALGSLLMVRNDRLIQTNAALLLLSVDDRERQS